MNKDSIQNLINISVGEIVAKAYKQGFEDFAKAFKENLEKAQQGDLWNQLVEGKIIPEVNQEAINSFSIQKTYSAPTSRFGSSSRKTKGFSFRKSGRSSSKPSGDNIGYAGIQNWREANNESSEQLCGCKYRDGGVTYYCGKVADTESQTSPRGMACEEHRNRATSSFGTNKSNKGGRKSSGSKKGGSSGFSVRGPSTKNLFSVKKSAKKSLFAVTKKENPTVTKTQSSAFAGSGSEKTGFSFSSNNSNLQKSKPMFLKPKTDKPKFSVTRKSGNKQTSSIFSLKTPKTETITATNDDEGEFLPEEEFTQTNVFEDKGKEELDDDDEFGV